MAGGFLGIKTMGDDICEVVNDEEYRAEISDL